MFNLVIVVPYRNQMDIKRAVFTIIFCILCRNSLTGSNYCHYRIYKNPFSPATRSCPPMVFSLQPICNAFSYLFLDNLNLKQYCIYYCCKLGIFKCSMLVSIIFFSTLLDREWLAIKYWVIYSNYFYGLAEQEKQSDKRVPCCDHPYSPTLRMQCYTVNKIAIRNLGFCS